MRQHPVGVVYLLAGPLALACGGGGVGPRPAELAAIDGTLCFEGEVALLTCGTNSDRLLSLCSRGESLRYRYGKPGAVELEYPDRDQPLQDAFKWESTETHGSMDGPPGGQFSKLSFSRDGTGYLIDERYFGEPPVIKIVVTPANGDPVTSDCDRQVDGSLAFVAITLSLPVDQAY